MRIRGPTFSEAIFWQWREENRSEATPFMTTSEGLHTNSTLTDTAGRDASGRSYRRPRA